MENLYSEVLDSVIESIKQTSEKLLMSNKLVSAEKLRQGFSLFSQKFSPNVLKSLDGELLLNTMFNIGNRDGLAYWLEFKNDDGFETNAYGSIAGGSSFKYVMYKRNIDDKWVTGNPQAPTVLSVDEAISLAREMRDILILGSDAIRELLVYEPGIDEYRKLQKFLDDNMKHSMSRLAWVHKYYHMIYPDLIDSFHVARFQRHGLICCGIKPPKEDNLYEMAGHYMLIARKCGLPIDYVHAAIKELYGPPVRYFRIGTGEEGKYWPDMKANSYVAIGWKELRDLRAYSESSDMKKDIQERLIILRLNDNKTASTKAGEIMRFYRGIETGDIVVAVSGEKVLGIGRVTGNYKYVEERPYPHCLSVEWIRIFDMPVKLPKPGEGKLTSCYPYKDIDNIMEINRLIREKPIIEPLPLTGIIAEIEGGLERKKQVILYGPPGTGKTYYAEKACCEFASRNMFNKPFNQLSDDEKKSITGDGRTYGIVRMCCFHPSYGYEDFIEGIRPRVSASQTLFEKKDGIFKRICSDALENPDIDYYLIIDEINRGDISRIFGELIMLIEKNKRGKQVTLPLSNEPFQVPGNVYIVGTMNTADRSIALLDVALRRRFGFIELMPDYTLLEGVVFEGLPLDGWLRELNARIREHLGKDARNLQIGHSYFLEEGKPVTGKDTFRRIVREDIIPLIEEYCYGDYDMISRILGEGLVDVKNQVIRTELFSSQDISNLVNALLSPCPAIRTGTGSIDESENEEDQDTDSSTGDEA